MDWKERASIVSALADSLETKGIWCNEDRLHKAVYFLQAVSGVPSSYHFVLDAHGPYSFELRDDLALFRSRNVLRLQAQRPPYGPSYAVTSTGKALQSTSATSADVIQYVAKKFAGLGAVGMERFSTALFVTCTLERDAAIEQRVRRFLDFKPDVQPDVAIAAIAAVDDALRESTEVAG